MKSLRCMLVLFVWVLAASGDGQSPAQTPKKNFVIYDNMSYKGKPDTTPLGMIPSDVLYENKIWPVRQQIGTLPDRSVFEALVRSVATHPGPLVIDIENLSLRIAPDRARLSAELLAKLADWAHEAVPGKIIGYYGTNTLLDIPEPDLPAARELARHVDAFFCPLYTFDDDRARWEKRAKTSLEQSQQLDPKKPVYFYLWPQYHVGSVKALRYVSGDYWKFELETARRYGDGVVLWSSGTYVWDPRSGWWDATQEFAKSLQASR